MAVVGQIADTGASDRVPRSPTAVRSESCLRNTPAHVAAFLGVLLGGGTVVVINPSRGDDRIRADIEALDLPLVIGDARRSDDAGRRRPHGPTVSRSRDVTDPPRGQAADGRSRCRPPGCRGADADQRDNRPAEADRPHLRHAGAQRDGRGSDRRRHRRNCGSGVAIVNAPLVHIGGVFRVLQCVCEARPFALLDRFELDRWADAVRRHRPKAVSLVPAALRMVLHSDLTPRGPGRASAPSPRAPRHCRPRTPTHSPRSSAYRS